MIKTKGTPTALFIGIRWVQNCEKRFRRLEGGTCAFKAMVSMWFSNETNLPTMIGLLDIIKTEVKKETYKPHGREVCYRLETSPKRKQLAKAHALFYKGLKEVKGGMSLKSTLSMVKFK